MEPAPVLPPGTIVEGQVLPALAPQIQVQEQLTPSQAIVTAQTPWELATATQATVPIVRDEAAVFPDSMPLQPATDPSAPAGFPDYTIRPEILGAPVSKYVPGMYDQGSLLSLFPSLTAAASVPSNPTMPTGAEPLPLPSPVKDIFNTRASEKIDQAIEMDYAANLQTTIADDLQRKADEAAFDANNALATATMDPTFDAQAGAAAAAARAQDSQYLADIAREKAAIINQSADDKAAEAAVATKQIEDAAANEQAAYNESVAQSDQHALDQALDTPGLDWSNMVPPGFSQPVSVPGFSVSPVMAAGVLGVVGYLLGGTRGGAVGALLGGAGAYFMRQQATPQYGPVTVAPGVAPGPAPMYLPPDQTREWIEGPGGTTINAYTGEVLVDEKGEPIITYYSATPPS